MAQTSPADADATSSEGGVQVMPLVRVEVRGNGGRPVLYEVGDGGFLVGSAPGCDLRLPGTNLPPIICLLARHAGGASLRRLAPSSPVQVNGRLVASTYLNDGDRVTVAGLDLVLNITAGVGVPLGSAELYERLRVVEAGERGLKEGREQLATEKADWEQRREDLAAEFRRQTEAVESASQVLGQHKTEVATLLADRETVQGELETARRERQESEEQVRRQRAALEKARTQIATYDESLLRLVTRQEAVRKAARGVQVAQRKLKTDTATLEPARQELARQQAEAEARNEQFQREKALFNEQHQVVIGRQQELQTKLAEQLADVETREQQLAVAQTELARGQQQHQADLVRLDRLQDQTEKQHKRLEQQAFDVDRRFEQLQRDSRELEEQALQLDTWREKLTTDQADLERRKVEHAGASSKLDQRAAALESQQATLATLRTRMERLREELRKQEQALSDQQALQEASAADLRQRAEEANRLRTELEQERELFQAERQRFEEQRVTVDGAMAELNAGRESLSADQDQVRQRQEEQDAVAVEQDEQAARLLARATQLEEWQARLAPERQALQERDANLSHSEQTLAALQEQVRRRSEEINERLRQVAEREKLVDAMAVQAGAAQKRDAEQRATLREELDARAAALQEAEQDLARREEILRVEAIRVKETTETFAGQRESLAAERTAWESERESAAQAGARTKAAIETARAEAANLLRQVPDLEAKAGTALERLVRARDQLRGHLTEVHDYARRSREDLEAGRAQVQGDVEKIRQRELALYTAQDDHRLAVAAFRQQLIEWRGIVDDLRQNFVRDGDRLERREAAVKEQVEALAATSARLEEHAGQLEQQHQQIVAQRSEVTRHLGDMREWYRKKLRDLSGIDVPVDAAADRDGDHEAAVRSGTPSVPPAESRRDILSVTGELEPGDRQLGDLLRSLDLIDADTLTVLLLEARRQRRSLRQLLLAGSYLTLYQLALIEAGNLDALVLGPVRVIDRLPSSPHEVVYRVFDPRHNREALLRHLAESDLHDAVRPDEFRQRFSALAAVTDPHLSATYEVLDIAGRPAVLQEWLKGLPSSEWTALAAAPGVWSRALAQAATALNTAHKAGLFHGRLKADSFVITAEGILKLVGVGEPSWLTGSSDSEPNAAADLAGLGALAATWAAAARKGSKGKAFPAPLHAVLDRLTATSEARRYPSAAALLEQLQDQVDVPANAAAWERFLQHVSNQSVDTALRRSA